MKRNVLVYSSPSLWPMLEYELEIIQKELNNSSKVHLISCQGSRKTCPANNSLSADDFSTLICLECTSRLSNGLKWLQYEKDAFEASTVDEHLHSYAYQVESILSKYQQYLDSNSLSLEQVRNKLNQELGFDAYESTLASIVSTTRNKDIYKTIDKSLFLGELENLLKYFYSLHSITETNKIDEVVIYNGRVGGYRSVLRACQRLKIPFRVYEFPDMGYENYVELENNSFQDLGAFSTALKEKTITPPMPGEPLYKAAEDYIKQRLLKSIPYVSGHLLNETITDIIQEPSQSLFALHPKTITFFTSSTDEYITSAEFTKQLYCTQIAIVEFLDDNVDFANVVVRVHPNATEKDSEEYENLQTNPNIHILGKHDKTDSHKLALASDLIVTFGSSIGYESAYLGKPVVRLAPSHYQSFSCDTYVPSLHLLISLIRRYLLHNDSSALSHNLELAKLNAIHYIAAYLNYGTPTSYLIKNQYKDACLTRDGQISLIQAHPVKAILGKLARKKHRIRKMLQKIFNQHQD